METVISKGHIKLLDTARWTIIFEQFSSIVIMLICLLIILAVTVFFRKSIQYFLHSTLLTTILSLSLFTGLCSLSFMIYTHAMIDSENINRKVVLAQKWKEKTAIPFIKSLPTQQQLLFKFEEERGKISVNHFIDSTGLLPSSIPERSSENDANLIDSNNMVKLLKGERITFTYALNEQLVSETGWTAIHFEPNESYLFLSWDNERHITFKRLTRDLGNGLTAGIYDIKIYLPQSDLETLFGNKVPDVKVSSEAVKTSESKDDRAK